MSLWLFRSWKLKCQEECALDSLLGSGTVFQRPGILLWELDLCHERWGKELLLPLQKSINRQEYAFSSWFCWTLWTGFPGVPPTSTPTPAPAWQELTYPMGWTALCWLVPFLGSFPPTFIYFLNTFFCSLQLITTFQKKKNKTKL